MSKIDAGLVVPIPILPVACWRTNCEVPNVSPPANVLVLVLVTARLVMVVVRFVIVASAEVRVSITPVVKCPRTEKRFVEVALVVDAFVAKKLVEVALVVVAFVKAALVAEKALVVLVNERLPPMQTLPVTVALLAVKLARVVEPAVNVPSAVAPETERELAEMLTSVKEPPAIVGLLMRVLYIWSILFVCAVT